MKLRAHTRLQRKPPQQRRAKGMNGLNFQTTRRLNGTGKQGSGFAQHRRVKFGFKTQLLQLIAQRGIGAHRPCPKPLKKPVLHFAGSRFRIGQA